MPQPKRTASVTPLDRAPSLTDQVTLTLRQSIQSGTFARGAQLPSENALAQQFSVSRAVIRESLSRLKQEGLLLSRQGAGVFVEKSPPIGFRIEGNVGVDNQIEEIVEFLSPFEITAAAIAAQRRTSADLDRMRQALDEMQAALAKGESGVAADLDFHNAIVAATKNKHMAAFSVFAEAVARNFIRTARENSARFKGLSEEAQGEHRLIYEAIAAQDADAAADAARAHLLNAVRRLATYRAAPADSKD